MKMRRIIAYMIDWYIISFLMNVLMVTVVYLKQHEIITNLVPIGYFDGNTQVVLLLLLLVIQIIYFCCLPILFNGQTLGKKITKLKIVNKDGTNVSFLNLLKRDLLGMVIIEGCFSPFSNYIRNVLITFIGRTFVQYLIYISFAMGLISILLMLFKKEKMLHDLIGGTKVIML